MAKHPILTSGLIAILYYDDALFIALEVILVHKAVDIAGQHIPKHFGIERVSEFSGHFGHVLDLSHSQLFLDAERMQKITAEDQRVFRCEDRVYPTGRYEEGIAGLEVDAGALFNLVAEEYVRLLA